MDFGVVTTTEGSLVEDALVFGIGVHGGVGGSETLNKTLLVLDAVVVLRVEHGMALEVKVAHGAALLDVVELVEDGTERKVLGDEVVLEGVLADDAGDLLDGRLLREDPRRRIDEAHDDELLADPFGQPPLKHLCPVPCPWLVRGKRLQLFLVLLLHEKVEPLPSWRS